MKKQKVYLDMDGTIANLYDQKNWLQKLQKEDKTIYLKCLPLITEEKLFEYFPKEYYEIVILSMTPKNCSKSYHKNVIAQKNEWLNYFFPHLTKRIYKKFGYNKNLKNSKNAILIDDSFEIRQSFKGRSYSPSDIWGDFKPISIEMFNYFIKD